MDEIFDFLNSTYETGQSILNGKGRIIGYANDEEMVSGVFSLSGEEIRYQIEPDFSPDDPHMYTLLLERSGQTIKHKHLYSEEIISLLKTGDSPLLAP